MRHQVQSTQHSIQHSALCPQFSTLALLPALPSPGPSPSPGPGPSLKLILAEGKGLARSAQDSAPPPSAAPISARLTPCSVDPLRGFSSLRLAASAPCHRYSCPRVTAKDFLAEGKGFEPPEPCGSSDFESDAIDHSATPPNQDFLGSDSAQHGQAETARARENPMLSRGFIGQSNDNESVWSWPALALGRGNSIVATCPRTPRPLKTPNPLVRAAASGSGWVAKA
jgi:hypothetical protein